MDHLVSLAFEHGRDVHEGDLTEPRGRHRPHALRSISQSEWGWRGRQPDVQLAVRLDRLSNNTKQGRRIGSAPRRERVDAVRSQDASRLGDGSVGLRKVVESEIADDPIEMAIAEWKGLCVANLELAGEALGLCHRDHVLGYVDPGHASALTCGRSSD